MYKPARGDRVRVVIEGQVSCAGNLAFTVGEDDDVIHIWHNAQVKSIEKISEPIPIEDGAVILIDGLVYQKTAGGWLSAGITSVYSSERVQEMADRRGFKVLK